MKFVDYLRNKNYQIGIPNGLVISPVLLGMLIFGIVYTRMCSNDSHIEGVKYFENGEYLKAMDCFNEYLLLYPHDVKTLYNRGRCYEILGKRDKAINDYYEVLDRDPNNMDALLSCTQVLYNSGECESATYLSSHAVLVDDDNYLAHYYNGRAHHKYGDLTVALTSYNKAIEINPDFGLAYFQRGSLMLTIGYPPFACYDLKVAYNLNIEGAKEAIDLYCSK